MSPLRCSPVLADRSRPAIADVSQNGEPTAAAAAVPTDTAVIPAETNTNITIAENGLTLAIC